VHLVALRLPYPVRLRERRHPPARSTLAGRPAPPLARLRTSCTEAPRPASPLPPVTRSQLPAPTRIAILDWQLRQRTSIWSRARTRRERRLLRHKVVPQPRAAPRACTSIVAAVPSAAHPTPTSPIQVFTAPDRSRQQPTLLQCPAASPIPHRKLCGRQQGRAHR